MICGHLAPRTAAASSRPWGGAKAFDWYGVGDTGSIAGEGPERDGLYVWEDAQYLELLDIETGAPVAAGETGDMVVTCLFKDDIAPCIRFNTHDITHELTGANQTGMVFRRIAGFKGRSDNMVKLRGINIFPHAIGALIEKRADLTGEYVCRLSREASGREELTVVLESRGGTDEAQLAALLRQGLGVEVTCRLVGPGETAADTPSTRGRSRSGSSTIGQNERTAPSPRRRRPPRRLCGRGDERGRSRGASSRPHPSARSGAARLHRGRRGGRRAGGGGERRTYPGRRVPAARRRPDRGQGEHRRGGPRHQRGLEARRG
jgi:hypothetical protein